MTYNTFPFGKYKGLPIAELPTTYITYALEEFDLPEELSFELKVIIALRLDLKPENSFINGVFRKMAKKYHPDKGGNDLQFQAINDFYQTIINNE
jgi:uncharacterized protein (DUF3820 family)